MHKISPKMSKLLSASEDSRRRARQILSPTFAHPLATGSPWLTVGLCVLQQPKPGEPLYAQVNLEKKKKRQYELGVGQGGQVGQVAGGSGGVAISGSGGGGGGQWVPDGVGLVPDSTGAPSVAATVANQVPPPSSTAAAAGDSWV